MNEEDDDDDDDKMMMLLMRMMMMHCKYDTIILIICLSIIIISLHILTMGITNISIDIHISLISILVIAPS
eukprot:12337580-Karenia_brevis.AAC.1